MPRRERRRGHDQNGRVDQKRAVHGDGRVGQVVLAGFDYRLPAARHVAALHQGRVQVQIVRHHRGAEDADGDVQLLAGQDVGHKPRRNPRRRRLTKENLDQEADPDDQPQRQDEGLQLADAEMLDQQQQQHVAAGDQHAPENGNAEQQIQPDGRAQHFGQIAGGNGDFAQPEQHVVTPGRILVVAGLGQVAAGHQPQPCAEGLEQHRHGVAHQQHPEQPVAELRAALDVGGPVAGVGIADRDEIGRPGEGEQPSPPPAGGDRHGAMDFFQRSLVVPAVGRGRHGDSPEFAVCRFGRIIRGIPATADRATFLQSCAVEMCGRFRTDGRGVLACLHAAGDCELAAFSRRASTPAKHGQPRMLCRTTSRRPPALPLHGFFVRLLGCGRGGLHSMRGPR